MKAIRLHQHGGPEGIRIDELPEPGLPGQGEIKVRVRAMALNHMDIWVRNGMPGVVPALPIVMGCDVAGEVMEMGEGVTEFASGDRVVLTPMVFCNACEACLSGEHSMCGAFKMRGEHLDGYFAEQVVVNTRQARKIAPRIAFESAAAFCLTYLTAWRMMIGRAGLRPGETVLIHGIGGGVSMATLQIANLVGAAAIVTSGEDWKIEKAMQLGAKAGFNYKTQDVAKEVFKFTQKRGVDVVSDSVGGSSWAISVKAARTGGRIVTCGTTGGANPPADLARIFWKQLVVMGSTMGNMREFSEVIRMLNEDKLAPIIDKIFPYDQIREAHEYLSNAQQLGKVALTF
jgi:NADPH:quinone reductase-like Zn-dependent oxidoreductase